jgi:hypothetical protein
LNPKLLFFAQKFAILIERGLCGGFKKIAAEGNVHAAVDLDELRLGGLESCCASFKNLGLEVIQNSFA